MSDEEQVTMFLLSGLALLTLIAAIIGASVGFTLHKKVLSIGSIVIIVTTGLSLFLAYQQLSQSTQAYCLTLQKSDQGQWICADPPPSVNETK